MNRYCKCESCGYVFSYEEAGGVREDHWLDGEHMGHETFLVCPNCGGDFEDASYCHECGEYFTENELYDDRWCEKCLRETINYDTFFEYCEANRDENYLDTFVMRYLLNCDEVPNYPSWEFHQLMVAVYEKHVETAKLLGSHFDFVHDCVLFVMEDDGSIGRENYAYWLHNKEVK